MKLHEITSVEQLETLYNNGHISAQEVAHIFYEIKLQLQLIKTFKSSPTLIEAIEYAKSEGLNEFNGVKISTSTRREWDFTANANWETKYDILNELKSNLEEETKPIVDKYNKDIELAEQELKQCEQELKLLHFMNKADVTTDGEFNQGASCEITSITVKLG